MRHTARGLMFWTLIAAEIIAIAGLGAFIFWQFDNPHSVFEIRKEDVVAAAGEFAHMYEPKPSSVGFGNNHPDWLPRPPQNTINQDALNERYDYAVEKPASTYRIVTLGDSHTFGVYVENEENYSEILEDMLNEKLQCANIRKFEVLNLGVPGYDVQYMVERFRLRGEKYTPDLVTLLLQDRQFEQHREYLKPLLDRHSEGKNAGDVQVWTDIWTASVEEMYRQIPKEQIEAYELSAFPRLAGMHEGSILMVPFGLSDRLRGSLQSFATERGDAFFTDPVPNLWQVSGAFPDGHPNPAGHRIIAELIFDYLARTNLIGCERAGL